MRKGRFATGIGLGDSRPKMPVSLAPEGKSGNVPLRIRVPVRNSDRDNP